MTDSKTATERICEQLEAAGLSFVRSEQIIEGTYWGVTWSVGETKFEFRENDERTDLIAFNATPEQAVAATLGSNEKPCFATDYTYKHCKYSVNRGWVEDTKFYIPAFYIPTSDTLRSGECEFKPFAGEDWDEPNAVRGVCSECSALMFGKDNFCPNCGKAVKR